LGHINVVEKRDKFFTYDYFLKLDMRANDFENTFIFSSFLGTIMTNPETYLYMSIAIKI